MSNNETQIGSNTALIKFTSDYEYVLGATRGRLLSISGMFHSKDFLSSQIEQIRIDLEETAKMFAEQQGLAPGAVGWGIDGWNPNGTPMLRINTGTLYNGIKAVRTGQTIHLRSEAKDKYGHYYGGHVEFGHGQVPPRPHLRPALYAVSQASQGKLRSALHNLFTGAFNGNMNMNFGTGGGLSASYYRNGPHGVASFLTSGTRGQQMNYHFGSIRNLSKQRGMVAVAHKAGYRGPTPHIRGVSRKATTFRNQMSSTAKTSMKWGKQKSLNPAQRTSYARRNSPKYRRLDKNRRTTTRNVISHRNTNSGHSYSHVKNKGSFPVQRAQSNNYNPGRYKSEWKAYKQDKSKKAFIKEQYNKYYSSEFGQKELSSSSYAHNFMQAQSNAKSRKSQKFKSYRGNSVNPFR